MIVARQALGLGDALTHDAIDGRLCFFPGLPDGWSSASSGGEQWYAIDLGKPIRLSRAELTLFDDGKNFAVPASYRLQALSDGAWPDLRAPSGRPLANGVTHVEWLATETGKVRILMRHRSGRAIRLVEFKLFDSI